MHGSGAMTAAQCPGFHEQIFGVIKQVRGQDQSDYGDISQKVIWEKQRTSTFSHHRRLTELLEA